jgi:hypothetical protein
MAATVETIALIIGSDAETVGKRSEDNARAFYGLDASSGGG